MLNNYKIFRRRQTLGKRIHQLHNTDQLAIGILDTGTEAQLDEALVWYANAMGCPLFVATGGKKLDVPALQERFEDVTFLVFPSMTFIGEQINAIANECLANCFLIVRSDQLLVRFDGAALLATMAKKDAPAAIAAVIANERREIVPCARAPHLTGRKLDPLSYFPDMEAPEGIPTLYPVMGLGLYDRALFQRMRGFDEQIHSAYWQALDWGIRSWLLGSRVVMMSSLLVQYPDRESVIEDRTESEGFLRCYTKALSVHRIGDRNIIKRPSGYVDRQVLKEEVRKRMVWLQKTDFATLCSSWSYPAGEKP